MNLEWWGHGSTGKAFQGVKPLEIRARLQNPVQGWPAQLCGMKAELVHLPWESHLHPATRDPLAVSGPVWSSLPYSIRTLGRTAGDGPHRRTRELSSLPGVTLVDIPLPGPPRGREHPRDSGLRTDVVWIKRVFQGVQGQVPDHHHLCVCVEWGVVREWPCCAQSGEQGQAGPEEPDLLGRDGTLVGGGWEIGPDCCSDYNYADLWTKNWERIL